MKAWLVPLNIAAAFFVVWGGSAICAVHRVHSYSTYVDLVRRGSIVATPEKTEELKSGMRREDDIVKSLESIGGLDIHLPKITYVAGALFLLNAAVFFAVWRKKPAQRPPELKPADGPAGTLGHGKCRPD